MKSAIQSTIGFVLGVTIGSVWAVDEDPKPLPRLDAILAAVQARAAKQMENTRQAGTVAVPNDVGPRSGEQILRQGAHVQQPSIDDRINALLDKRRSEASQPVPSFLMRADGRPLGAGSFSDRASFSGKPLFGQNNKQIREIMGCLKIDHDSNDVPQFKVYFEGMETTNNNEGFFKFPVDNGNIEKYAIIICNKIKHVFGRHNTVDSFGLIPDMNYKYFRFKRNADGSQGWVQQERDLRKQNLQIPSNAIVVTINPAYFDHLETEWPGNFGSNTLKLPRIVFKSGHRAKLERKAIKSLLHGLDMSPFHTNVQHVSKEIGDGKGEVSVPFAM